MVLHSTNTGDLWSKKARLEFAPTYSTYLEPALEHVPGNDGAEPLLQEILEKISDGATAL